MGPRVINQDTHGTFDDIKNVVLRVRVSTRTLRVRLKPPLRDGVARLAFGFVGLEDGSNTAHRIGTALTGAKNHSFARWDGRFIHACLCWKSRACLKHLTKIRSATAG